MKNQEKSLQNATSSKDAPKIRKKFKQIAKKCENWPNMAPKRRAFKIPTEYAKPCLASKLIFKSIQTPIQHTGGGPPRIVYASRIPLRRPRTLRTWLESARNFGQMRLDDLLFLIFRRISVFQFFVILGRILRSKRFFDVKVRFLDVCRFTFTDSPVCTIFAAGENGS